MMMWLESKCLPKQRMQEIWLVIPTQKIRQRFNSHKGGAQKIKPPNVKNKDNIFVVIQFSMMNACNTMGTNGT